VASADANLSAPGTETWLDWAIGIVGEVFVDQKFMALMGQASVTGPTDVTGVWIEGGPGSGLAELVLVTDGFIRALGAMLIGIALYRMGFLPFHALLQTSNADPTEDACQLACSATTFVDTAILRRALHVVA